MTTLMGFVLNTVKPRLNDPNNPKMWLPALLMSMRNAEDKPVLPINEARSIVGARVALYARVSTEDPDRMNAVRSDRPPRPQNMAV